ncbi:peptidase M23, partial [Pseudomonas aeruginosa]
MPRTLAFVSTLLLAAFCALPAQADSFIMRLLNKPVPGGVAVVDLGEEGPPPRAFYQGKPVLVVREEGRRWIAVVGIPLSTKPGPQKLEVRAAIGNHEERFSVGSKHYREQRITLKNKRQVNPLPEDLKR